MQGLLFVVREQFMGSVPLYVYLTVYEFRYQGHLFTRKRYVCEQFLNVYELYMNNCLSKFEHNKSRIFQILHIFSTPPGQFNAFPAIPLKPALGEGQCQLWRCKNVFFVTSLNL